MPREIYISGKIGGEVQIACETYKKFHRAEQSLTNCGREPFNAVYLRLFHLAQELPCVR